jgi:hypothetical protein
VLIEQTPIVAEGKPKSGAAAHKWGLGHEATITPNTIFSLVVDTAVNVRAVDHLEARSPVDIDLSPFAAAADPNALPNAPARPRFGFDLERCGVKTVHHSRRTPRFVQPGF